MRVNDNVSGSGILIFCYTCSTANGTYANDAQYELCGSSDSSGRLGITCNLIYNNTASQGYMRFYYYLASANSSTMSKLHLKITRIG